MATPIQSQIGQPPQYTQQPQVVQQVQGQHPQVAQPFQGQQPQVLQQFQGQQPQVLQQVQGQQPQVLQQVQGQQPQVLQQVQGQQPQVLQQPQVIYHRHTSNRACCNPYGRTLSQRFQPAHLGLAITFLINGIASVIFGIIGIFTAYGGYYVSGHYTVHLNPTAWIGADIWAGIFYILCGTFAIITHKPNQDIHMMNCFFAFSIISFALSIPHVAISLGYMFYYGVYYSIWFNIVSLIMAIVGLCFSLTFIVFLSKDIYCTKSPLPAGNTVHYHGGGHAITVQQYSNQPVTMPYQPMQSAYVQASPIGHQVVMTNQNPAVQPEPVKSRNVSHY